MQKKFLLGAASAVIACSFVATALAEDGASSTSSAPASKTYMNMKKKTTKLDGSCMSKAVAKRDTALSSALQIVVTALQTRGTALSAAWALTDITQRKEAVKAADTAFKGTWKTFTAAREAAWKQFRGDAKACKVSAADAGAQTTESGGL